MRNRLTRVHLGHRLRLESLEVRLQPGDALLGVLFGTAALPGDTPATREAGEATPSVSILSKDDLDVLELMSPPSEIVPVRESPQLSRRSTELMDGVETLLGPDTARHISINPIMPSSGGQHFVANASSNVGMSRDAKPGVSVLPGELSKPLSLSPNAARKGAPTHDVHKSQSTARDYGKLPLTFEANMGQTDSRVDFIARTGGGTVFLTPTAAVFSITKPASVDASARRDLAERGGRTPHGSPETNGVALHMQIVGGNPNATPVGHDRQPGIVNYFVGNDSSQWHANIPTFGGVEYRDVYPGIDLAYYGNNGQLEYDFIVSPGTDPNGITLNFAGADGVDINPQGNLVVHTAIGDVVQQKPLTYQQVGGTRQEITSRYHSEGASVRFELGSYDTSRPLIIDPLVLGYSTYLGGPGGAEDGRAIAADSAGNAYTTGSTTSTQFPVTPGAFDATLNGNADTFVAKLNAAGSALAYATYLGGSEAEVGEGIALDDDGNAYISGTTYSTDFPTTPGAFDTTFGGGCSPSSPCPDAFVVKLNATGAALAYSTYLGANGSDVGGGIDVDAEGNAYVTGTASNVFPTTPGAFDSGSCAGDAFATKLNAAGSALIYSTCLGGSSWENYESPGDSATIYRPAIVVDGSGNAHITGSTNSTDFPTTLGAFDTTHNHGNDAFVTKLNADGSALIYSTYLGGGAIFNGGADYGTGIALDASGNAFVTGITFSANFPTTPGAFDTTYNSGGKSDAYVAKFDATGSALVYATYLGGVGQDVGHSIAVDASGSAYVTGYTVASDFPTTALAFDTSSNGGEDAFVTKLDLAGTALSYSTYLGGSSSGLVGGDYGNAIAIDSGGSVYVTGQTFGSDFPTTPGALKRRNRFGQADAFVTKFAEA